jgi:hypothetical protein
VSGPPAVELAWTRGDGAGTCIDGRELAARVEATIGRSVRAGSPDGLAGGRSAADAEGSPADATPLRLDGQVLPLGHGWIAVVQVQGAGPTLRREVTLDVTDCRQLDEALVLVVALMAEAAVPSARRLTLPVRASPASVGIGHDVAMAIGMLPGVVPGFGLATELSLPPVWHLAAWAHAWPFSQALDGGSGGRLTAWTFGAGPCLGPTAPAGVSFFGCAGASGGVVYASGIGLDLPHTSARPYLQAEVRAGLRVRVSGPMFLRLEGGLGVPISRDSYEFTDADGATHTVFKTAAVVPLGRLAVEFRAP